MTLPPKSKKTPAQGAEPRAEKPPRSVKKRATAGMAKRYGPSQIPGVVPLTELEARFVDAFVTNPNKVQAYWAAGGTASEKNAKSAAYQMYERYHVFDAIQKRLAEKREANKVTAAAVIQRLATIAFGDIRTLADWDSDEVYLTPTSVLTEEQAALVAGVTQEFSKTGQKTVKLQTHNQLKALELLGKHFGLFAERSDDGDPLDVARKIQEALQAMQAATSGEPSTDERGGQE